MQGTSRRLKEKRGERSILVLPGLRLCLAWPHSFTEGHQDHQTALFPLWLETVPCLPLQAEHKNFPPLASSVASSGLLCGLLGLLWPPHHLWLFTAYLTFCCFSRRFPICAEFSSWNNPVSVDSLPKPQSWQSRYCKAPPDSFFLRYKCLFQTKPLSSCSLS